VEFNDLGHLKHIVNLDKNLTVSFIEQGFYWYASKYYGSDDFHILFVQGHPGDQGTLKLPASGAYIFRPLFQEALPVSLSRSM
jgi:hypothetical protein